MPQAVSLGAEGSLSLATTVTLLTGLGPAKVIELLTCDVDVYVVTSPTATDGGALPASGRTLFSASVLPAVYDIAQFGTVGLAGSASGTLRYMVR